MQEGNLLQAWGGDGDGFDWPRSEHGIFVDANDHVWLAGNDKDNDAQVLEFTRDGKFVMQIGEARHTEGSNSTRYLGRPALAIVDESAHEVYVADGYGNKRVVVFDARTGEYRRHWGAYGAKPDDADAGKYDPARRSRNSSATRCTACASRATAWSTSATGSTTASRCSARTARS